MRNVGQSVGGIGDSALEEAAEYFVSVSELLEEKLKAKRAAESRLMQLLTHIEAASLCKPGSEDSALFSEDSGIGAESESLAGSERQLRRECGKFAGTYRSTTYSPNRSNTAPSRQRKPCRKFTKKVSPSNSLNSLDSASIVMAKGQKDTESMLGCASLDDGEEEEDECEREEKVAGGRKRSSSSPSDPSQPPRRMAPKRIENPQNVEMSLKMKNAISGRILFVPSQHDSVKTKTTESPKTSRRQWTEGEERTPKRPQTAAPVQRTIKKSPVPKDRRSHSAESLRCRGEDPTLLELERTQRDLSQRLQQMRKGRMDQVVAKSLASNRVRPNNNSLLAQNKAVDSKINSKELETGKEMEEKRKDKKTIKGPLKATQPSPALRPLKVTLPPSPPMSPRPSSQLYQGRNYVKRLIDTFSQGMDESKQDATKMLGPLKGVRKCGVPVMPGVSDVETMLNSGGSSCRVDNIDLESLPPPALEVLMDNSFECAQSFTVSNTADRVASMGRSPVPKRANTQKLRASMQSVTVLPSRGNAPQGSSTMSHSQAVRQDTADSSRVGHQEPDIDLETEEAARVNKQDITIIHLRHSTESQIEKVAYTDDYPAPPPSVTSLRSHLRPALQSYANFQPLHHFREDSQAQLPQDKPSVAPYLVHLKHGPPPQAVLSANIVVDFQCLCKGLSLSSDAANQTGGPV
ncbi:hypothetical protein DPEC_G00294930 [Dallia pectoralis]|uniref:Uncharacterized protein n=1 Tax=Dallia pectoralis TaxID=75939 RepID=A0ACC2FIM1_DALPE|nr:hypothetical protein DPEC_G00294930 [Dallia pectoralis]